MFPHIMQDEWHENKNENEKRAAVFQPQLMREAPVLPPFSSDAV
jgi:hypothetical protein